MRLAERSVTLVTGALIVAVLVANGDQVGRVFTALANAVNYNAACILAGECNRAGVR